MTDAPPPFTLADLRAAATAGDKLAMLTCYDFTTARHLAAAGVKLLLVGDSAANVILGHPTTLPVSLEFMIEIAGAVKRGAPRAFVVADLPFGSTVSTRDGARAAVKMIKRAGVDAVKIETTRGHLGLIQRLEDAGVAVFAHLGLTPQSIGTMGRYRAQGRTADEAMQIADLALDSVNAGASGLLLEAVPPPVSKLIVDHAGVPVIGCGAGPACHAHVVVLHDLLGLTETQPKFAPPNADFAKPLIESARRFQRDIADGRYPTAKHAYAMPGDQSRELSKMARQFGFEAD